MLGKILRIIAIILMGLTAAFMFLGGIGTICIAWWPGKYESLKVMIPYKPIYQTAAILTIAGGLAGIWATVKLRNMTKKAFFYAMLVLLLSLLTAGVKMHFSNKVRHSVAPTNIRFSITLVTLVYLLILRIPGIWQQVKNTAVGSSDGGGDIGMGVASILAALATLTVQFWAGSTHTLAGINYADVWHVQLAALGWGLLFIGVSLIARHVTWFIPNVEQSVSHTSPESI